MARKKPAGPVGKKKEATRRWNEPWNPKGPSKEPPRSLFLECQDGHMNWRGAKSCHMCGGEVNVEPS